MEGETPRKPPSSAGKEERMRKVPGGGMRSAGGEGTKALPPQKLLRELLSGCEKRALLPLT